MYNGYISISRSVILNFEIKESSRGRVKQVESSGVKEVVVEVIEGVVQFAELLLEV